MALRCAAASGRHPLLSAHSLPDQARQMFVTRIVAASIAALAALGFAAAASAASTSAATASKYVNTTWIVVEGHRYGGQIPIGADKNLEALKVLIKVAD